MNKPKGVYLVAIWIFFGFGSLFLLPALRVSLPKIIESQQTIQLISMASMVLLLYLVVGVSLVKIIPRNITIALFSIASLYQIYGIASYLLFGGMTETAIKVIAFKAFLIVPTVWSVYYLVSKGFQKKANEFLKSKKELASQKFANKQLSKNI